MSHESESQASLSEIQIRNFSIISHVDHGKTTLSDHLLAEGGMLPQHLAGSLRALDFLPEEQKRGITIESSFATFFVKYRTHTYQVNLIDTPGHIDFSGKVTESLRLVENGLILVDAVEGIMAQTRTVLKQALQERLTLILFINKIDRLITEMGLSPQSMRLRIERIIGEINDLCRQGGYQDQELLSFEQDNVILGSATDGWAIDSAFVANGGKIENIISFYPDAIQEIRLKLNLSQTLTKAIVSKFISPETGQKEKFERLQLTSSSRLVVDAIYQCNNIGIPVIMIGRYFLFGRQNKLGYIVKILSGTIEQGVKLYSMQLKNSVTILELFQFRGKKQVAIPKVGAGNLVGILFSDDIPVGDVLTPFDGVEVQLGKLAYVQNPIVTVSIEPENINDYDRLVEAINKIVKVTPGLETELNQDSGELLINGVGTLQLDILKEDLLSLDINVQMSEPQVISHVIPTENSEFESLDHFHIVKAGKTSEMSFDPADVVYEDPRNNKLQYSDSVSVEFLDGLISQWKHLLEIDPKFGKKISNLGVIVESLPVKQDVYTYEEGILTASRLLKQVELKSKCDVHDPYLLLELRVPLSYLGKINNVINQNLGNVINTTYLETMAKVKAEVPAVARYQLVDSFREVTDGNAFWSFLGTVYKLHLK